MAERSRGCCAVHVWDVGVAPGHRRFLVTRHKPPPQVTGAPRQGTPAGFSYPHGPLDSPAAHFRAPSLLSSFRGPLLSSCMLHTTGPLHQADHVGGDLSGVASLFPGDLSGGAGSFWECLFESKWKITGLKVYNQTPTIQNGSW